jgi:hypothetical protein
MRKRKKDVDATVITILLLPILTIAQPSFSVLTGKATGVAGDRITVQSGPISTLLYADKDSKIWRGKTTNALSVVQPGDDVIVRYRRDPAGHFVILDLSANIEHVWGNITKVARGEFEVDENPNADPQSGYRRGKRQIVFDSDTEFEGSAAEDLRIGRNADIIGLKLDGARVQASRITVYEGNSPVRMPPGARVVVPNGQIK